MDSEAFWSSQSADQDLHKALCQKDEGVSLASGAETWEKGSRPSQPCWPLEEAGPAASAAEGRRSGRAEDPSSLGHGKSETETQAAWAMETGTGVWGRERCLPVPGGGLEPFSPAWADTGDNFYTDVPGDILLSRGHLGMA